jgi:hypothetical protein
MVALLLTLFAARRGILAEGRPYMPVERVQDAHSMLVS